MGKCLVSAALGRQLRFFLRPPVLVDHIQDLRIYNRALSAAEIQAIYNSEK